MKLLLILALAIAVSTATAEVSRIPWSMINTTGISGLGHPYKTVGTQATCDYVINGTSDETKINQAIDASPNSTIILCSNATIDGEIALDQKGTILMGAGSGLRRGEGITIKPAAGSTSLTLINITGKGSQVKDLNLVNNTAVMAGGYGIYVTGFGCEISNVYFSMLANGVKFSTGADASHVDKCQMIDITGKNIDINGAWECFITDTFIDGGAGQSDYGLYAYNIGNVYSSDTEYIRCGTVVYLWSVGAGKFTNCFFDQQNAPVTLSSDDSTRYNRNIIFANCWFGGLVGATQPLVLITSSGTGTNYNIEISDSSLWYAGTDAIKVDGSASHIDVLSNEFAGVAAVSAGACVSITDTTHFKVSGNSYHTLGSGQTEYGIYMSGSQDNYIITGNDFEETDTFSAGDDGGSKVVDHNLT